MPKKSTEKLVPVKEFDVEKIHEAFREGRLFILPATENPTEATIHGHNEFSSKSCPCFNVRPELPP